MVTDPEEHQPDNDGDPVAAPATSRIEIVWMDPYRLAANPANPRSHPARQRRAIKAALDTLGWLQPLLYNRRTETLIDGHMRRESAIENGVQEVPVIVVDLDEQQEAAALASVDGITGLANVDESAYQELLASLDGMDDLVLELQERQQQSLEEVRRAAANERETTAVHLVPGEQYNYVVLLFRNDIDWLAAIEHFRINEPAVDLFHGSKVVGRTRVVEGADYMRRVLEDA